MKSIEIFCGNCKTKHIITDEKTLEAVTQLEKQIEIFSDSLFSQDVRVRYKDHNHIGPILDHIMRCCASPEMHISCNPIDYEVVKDNLKKYMKGTRYHFKKEKDYEITFENVIADRLQIITICIEFNILVYTQKHNGSKHFFNAIYKDRIFIPDTEKDFEDLVMKRKTFNDFKEGNNANI